MSVHWTAALLGFSDSSKLESIQIPLEGHL